MRSWCPPTASLGLFNLIVVLGPAVGLCGALLGLWVCVAVLFASPVAMLISLAVDWSFADLVKGLFMCCVAVGLGLVMFSVALAATSGFYRLLVRYLQANRRIIRGGYR